MSKPRSHAAPHRATTNPMPRILLAVICFLLTLVAGGAILLDYDLGTAWITTQAALMTVFFIAVFTLGYMQMGTFYLLSSGFLITLSVFHVSYTYLHALGLLDLTGLAESERGYWYEMGGWYIFLSMACFGMGLAFGRRVRRLPPLEPERQARNLATIYWTGVGLMVASTIFFGMTLLEVGNIFRYSRAELFKGVGDTRGFGVFLMTFPTSLMLLVLGSQTRMQRILALTAAVIGILFIMFLGYRSAAITPILVGGIMWNMMGRRIPLPLLLGGGFIILVLIPAVSYLRAQGSYQDLTAADFSKSLEQTSAGDTFRELGAIGGIVANIIEWVPTEVPYEYGATYLFALKYAIPNVGIELGEAERLQDPDGKTSAELLSIMGPSNWYIYRVNKWMFKNGGGGGFSMVAEAYLNFGFSGVVVIFTALGFLFGRLDGVRLTEHARTTLILAALMWPLYIATRNEFGNLVKPTSFNLITMLIWQIGTGWYAQTWRRKYIRMAQPRTRRQPATAAAPAAGKISPV